MRLLRRFTQWLTSLVVPDVVFEGWARERHDELKPVPPWVFARSEEHYRELFADAFARHPEAVRIYAKAMRSLRVGDDAGR